MKQLHPHHPHKDFAKYDFFQILSIVYVSSSLGLFLFSLLISESAAVSFSWSTWVQAN